MRCIAAAALVIGWLCVARGESLTFEACRDEAFRNNPSLAAARAAVDQARHRLDGSRSTLLPQLSASAGYRRSGSERGGEASVGSSSDIGLSARQTIFTGGRNRAQIRQSRASLDLASESLRQAKAQVTYDLRTAYARLLYAQEAVRLTASIAERRGTNVNLVALRFESGREHKGSLLVMEAAHNQAQFEATAAQRELLVAQTALARVLGRRSSRSLAAEGVLTTPPAETVESDQMRELARATPEAHRSEARRRSAEAGLSAARGAFWPDVSATASAGRSGDDWPPENTSWSLGVQLSFPFFPGGRNIYDIRASRAELRQAEADEQNVEDQLVRDLEQSLADVRNAVERVQVQERLVEAATLRAQIARVQYASGLLSFDNWDPIENELIAQEKSLLASRRDAVYAAARWDQLLGRNVFD